MKRNNLFLGWPAGERRMIDDDRASYQRELDEAVLGVCSLRGDQTAGRLALHMLAKPYISCNICACVDQMERGRKEKLSYLTFLFSGFLSLSLSLLPYFQRERERREMEDVVAANQLVRERERACGGKQAKQSGNAATVHSQQVLLFLVAHVKCSSLAVLFYISMIATMSGWWQQIPFTSFPLPIYNLNSIYILRVILRSLRKYCDFQCQFVIYFHCGDTKFMKRFDTSVHLLKEPQKVCYSYLCYFKRQWWWQ